MQLVEDDNPVLSTFGQNLPLLFRFFPFPTQITRQIDAHVLNRLPPFFPALSSFYSLKRRSFLCIYLQRKCLCVRPIRRLQTRMSHGKSVQTTLFLRKKRASEWPQEIKNNSCPFPQKPARPGGETQRSLLLADSPKWNFRLGQVWNFALATPYSGL